MISEPWRWKCDDLGMLWQLEVGRSTSCIHSIHNQHRYLHIEEAWHSLWETTDCCCGEPELLYIFTTCLLDGHCLLSWVLYQMPGEFRVQYSILAVPWALHLWTEIWSCSWNLLESLSHSGGHCRTLLSSFSYFLLLVLPSLRIAS